MSSALKTWRQTAEAGVFKHSPLEQFISGAMFFIAFAWSLLRLWSPWQENDDVMPTTGIAKTVDMAADVTVSSLQSHECAGILLAGLSAILLVFAMTLLSIGLVTSCKAVVAFMVNIVWVVGEVGVALVAAVTSGSTITMSIVASVAVAVYTLPPSAIPIRIAVSSCVSTGAMLAAGSTLFYVASFPFQLEVCVGLITAAAASVGCASAWAVGVMSLVERDTHRSGLKMTTILDAVRRNNHRLLRLLVKLHAGLKQRDLDYALLHAVKVGLPECTEVLLETGANPNTLDSHENSPLVVACETGNRKIANIILDHGADVNLRNGPNGTALHFAAKWGYEDVVMLLLARGAEVNVQDGLWRTPLMLAVANAHNAGRISEMLIDAGCDVRILGTYGRTVLHCASSRGLDIQSLLAAGADPSAADSDGHTALHVAAREGRQDVVSVLLEVGCDPHCLNSQQQTALHLASMRAKNLSCIQCLVEAGSDPAVPDINGHSPIWLATSHGHLRTVQYLIRLNVPLGPYHGDGTCHKVINPLGIALQRQHLAIAKVLLIGGCDPAPLSEWLLEIPPDCVAAYYNTPYIKWLRTFVSHTPRLFHQCRLVIRRRLDRNLPKVIDDLPLPRPIRSYISMQDVDDSLDCDTGVLCRTDLEPSTPK